MVGEIAARLSGGYMSGWTFPYHSGVDVTRGALNIAVGEPPGDLTPVSGNVSAERAIISIPGTIRKAAGIDGVKKIPGVRDLFTVCLDGDTVQFPKNNVQKWGNVISCSENRDASVKAAEQGCSVISVILEPGIGETFAFLLGKLDSWAPDAYRLQVKENSEALETMAVAEGDLLKAVSALVPLPRQQLEKGEDWNHVSFQSGLEKVCSITGITFLTASSDNAGAGVLGRMFWRAFLRGGYQGGVWLVETVRELVGKKRDLITFINQWDRHLD
jgi:hypothetical protein